MLSQIIYARCRYYFDYNKNNKKFYFKEAEEFGWFNFSTDIQSKFPSIIDIVCSNLNDVVVNAADSEKEKLDIKNSFSYIKLKEKDRNVYVFIRLFVKQDKGSNTPTRFSRGNKHFLIGSLENSKCLPYQFLSTDADCWAASSIKEEDFYDNNKNRPRLLDIDPAKINFKEELHLPKADSDKKPEKPNCLAGKTDLLKKITAFVFEQLSPEYTGPKRTLLIKDTPENLVLWIKAVSDILPLHWARELTFSTNVSDIDRKAQQRLQGTDGKLFFVIAGIDPKDASCANIPASQMYIVADPAAAPDKQFSYTSGLLEREFFKNLNLPNAGQRNPIEFWKKHPNLSPLEAINAYDAYLKVNKVSSDVIAHPEHLENYISEYSNFNDAETVQAFYKQLEIIFKDDKVLGYAISQQLLPFVKMVDWINNKNKLLSQNKQLNDVFNIELRLKKYFSIKTQNKEYDEVFKCISQSGSKYNTELCKIFVGKLNTDLSLRREYLQQDLQIKNKLQLFFKICEIIKKDYVSVYVESFLNSLINNVLAENINDNGRNFHDWIVLLLLSKEASYLNKYRPALCKKFIELYANKLSCYFSFDELFNIFVDYCSSKDNVFKQFSEQERKFLNSCIEKNKDVGAVIKELTKIKDYDKTWFNLKIDELMKVYIPTAGFEKIKKLCLDPSLKHTIVKCIAEHINDLVNKFSIPQNLDFFIDTIYAEYSGTDDVKKKYLDTIVSKCIDVQSFNTVCAKIDKQQVEEIIKNRLNEKLRSADYEYIKQLVEHRDIALTVLFEKCDVAPLLKKNIDDILALFKTYYGYKKSLSAGNSKKNLERILSGYKQADKEKIICEKTKNEEIYKNFLKKSKEIKEWKFAINPVDEFPNLYGEWTGEKTDFLKANTDTLSLYYSLFPDCKEKILEEIKQFYSNAISWIEKIVDLEESMKEKSKLYEYHVPVKSSDGSPEKTFTVSIRQKNFFNSIKQYLLLLSVSVLSFVIGGVCCYFYIKMNSDKYEPQSIQAEAANQQNVSSTDDDNISKSTVKKPVQQTPGSTEENAEASEKDADVKNGEPKNKQIQQIPRSTVKNAEASEKDADVKNDEPKNEQTASQTVKNKGKNKGSADADGTKKASKGANISVPSQTKKTKRNSR